MIKYKVQKDGYFSGYFSFAEAGTSIITLREEPIQFLQDSSYDQYCPATLYVKNATIEQKFEAADTDGMFGATRIKVILELIGNSTITVSIPNKYIDPGVNVAGYPSEDLEEFPELGFTFEANTIAVDNALANKKPGEYTVTYTLKYNGEVFATATRKVIVKSALKIPSLSGNYVYTGTEQTVILNDFDQETMNVTGNKKTDADNYKVTVTLKNPSSDSWEDGTNTAKTINWKIEPKSVEVIWNNVSSWVYDGNPHIPSASAPTGIDNETISLSITGQITDIGDGTAIASISGVSGGQGNVGNYILTNTTKKFKITKKPIAVPTGTNFTYDGMQHTGLAGTVQYTVGGTYQATKVGNYVAKATPTKNYMWTDGSYNTRNVSWSITAKSFRDGSIIGSLSQSTYEYDKKQKTPDITVKDGDKVLTPGVDYDVRYENNTEVGTAKVVITGKGNYEGMIEKEFTIQDTTAPSIPIVTAKINQAGGEIYVSGTWTNQNIYVSLQSTDYSTLKYQYRIGTTGTWQDMPAGGVKLYEDEMNQDLYYRAVDKYGNTSEASSLSVRIDKTPPEKGTLKANIRDEHGLEYEFGKVTDKSVYFRLDYLGSDQGGSELKNTTYILEEVDDNQRDHVLRTLATNETSARTLKESGTYRVIVVTEDGAGNITRSDPYYIIIDRDFTNIIRLNNLYDVGSGIKDITITITKEGESEPTYTEQISTYEANFVKRVKLPDGTFDVNVVIQDKAGNSKTLTGRIDNVIW